MSEKWQAALRSSGGVDMEEWQVLICQRPNNKSRALLLEFVGGKVEKGASKEESLIRECREELAIDIAWDGIFTEVTHDYPDIIVHLTLFNSRIVGGNWHY